MCIANCRYSVYMKINFPQCSLHEEFQKEDEGYLQELRTMKGITRQIHSDSKKRRSYLALLFVAGDLRRYTASPIVILSEHLGYIGVQL